MPSNLTKLKQLRDRTAVVGVGASPQGTFPDSDAYTLALQAFEIALGECGLTRNDIDGLIVQGPGGISFSRMGEMLGINPIVGGNFDVGGPATGPLIQYAAMLITSGMCETVALLYGNASRTEGRKFGGATTVSPGNEYSTAFYYYGLTSPGAASAFQARLHFDTYGTTSAQLAAVPIAQRKHAILNPQAIKKEPLTVEKHQQSKFICEPLHVYDYCLINDGGVALIITSAERAKDMPKKPVFITGMGRQDTYRNSSLPNVNLWRDSMPKAADMVYGMADVTRADVDAVMIYDSFSINIWFSLENFGFCREGEAGDFTQGGRIELGGELPVNTHGGHLSESYMQGWLHQVEAVRQLRHECGERQVKDAELIQYICRANVASSLIYRN